MRIRARFLAIRLYLFRFMNWFRTSSPYISGDAFSLLADFRYSPPSFWRYVFRDSSLSSAKTIFCPSHLLEEFVANHSKEISAQTLILGNSDRDFTNFDVKIPASVTRVFAQNLNSEPNVCQLLPIGLENRRLGRNGFTKSYKALTPWANKIPSLLIGPMSMTHSERNDLRSFEFEAGPWKVQKHFLSFNAFADLSSMYRFVACPRGNGIDTHRFWETLYRGSVPVVLKSKWAENVKQLGVPVITINSWSTENVTEAISSNLSSGFDPCQIKALWLEYWKNKI
jgi:hypothetical protein